jgi:hypothetical protein
VLQLRATSWDEVLPLLPLAACWQYAATFSAMVGSVLASVAGATGMPDS